MATEEETSLQSLQRLLIAANKEQGQPLQQDAPGLLGRFMGLLGPLGLFVSALAVRLERSCLFCHENAVAFA